MFTFRHLRTVLLSRQMRFFVGRGYCNYTEGEVYNLRWLKLSLFRPDINLVPKVSHLTAPLRRARRDPGTHWSRAALTIENIREGSSVIRQFVALSFVEFKVSRCAATDITRDV